MMFFSIAFANPAKPSFGDLMPQPKQIKAVKGRFVVNEQFQIAVRGKGSAKLFKAASRALNRLRGRTGFFMRQAFVTKKVNPDSAAMVISIQRPGNMALGEDESYELNVSPQKILLNAPTDLGALHGLETFLQLLSADEQGYFLPAVQIEDAPRFPWRGLLIDACRHFMPVKMIERNLDGMAAVKMNVLHWHLSEDQAFRVECKTFPKLQQLASDGFYYTQAQIKEIIAYAADRGIRVMPEFDLPGHATSWLTAYPEFASAPGPYSLQREWGIFDPVFDPTNEGTYTFLEAFFKEMSALFTDEYMHIGGDENNGKQWDANVHIQKFMKENHIKNNRQLQSYFNKRLLKILTKYHKKMVGWDEIFQPDLPKNIIIQSWRGRESMVKAAQQGYRTILSHGYYIDLLLPASTHYLNDPAPADLPLNAQQRKLILGGEATMWSEMVSPENVDSRIWPRTAAIAERFWSPDYVRDVDDMYRRLKTVSFHLEELGLTHIKNYAVMLRRLTDNAPIEPLKTLVDIIEPVKLYKRHQLRKHYTYSPLTRVVDAARPDAETARNFRNTVEKFIQKADHSTSIINRLVAWRENDKKLQPLIHGSPVLKEIAPLSKNISNCALIGLEAMNYILNKNKAPHEWRQKAKRILEQAQKPVAQTELMILPALKALAKRAAEDDR